MDKDGVFLTTAVLPLVIKYIVVAGWRSPADGVHAHREEDKGFILYALYTCIYVEMDKDGVFLTTAVLPLTIKYTVVVKWRSPLDGVAGLGGLTVQAQILKLTQSHSKIKM